MTYKTERISNIPQLYIIKLSKWLMLTMPIVFLFYKENGLGTTELFVLKAAYSLAIVVLEIPSGYIGDIWGRKNAMVIGAILGTLGFGIYSIASGFYAFLMAEIILGIGQSFISGSDSALLYDSLLDAKKENHYMKAEGRLISVGNYAEAIAAPFGVMLAAASLRTPYFVQTLIAFSAIPAALTLREPVRKKLSSANAAANMRRIIDYTCIQNKPLFWNIIASSVIGTATLTMGWLVQPLFAYFALPLAWYGIFIPALNLTTGTVSMVAHVFERKAGFETTLFVIVIGVPLLYLAIGWFNATWALAFLFVFYIIRGVATPVLKNHINHVTPSEIRATVLSLRSLIIRLAFVVLGPVLGWYADTSSLSSAMLAGGMVFLAAGLLSSFRLIYPRSDVKSYAAVKPMR